ncbi:hypothetical protein ACD661_04210 [Legionella lytica]|uniref:KIF-binding protein n=1 Tax=Legionella lytica TaxID=96232 RepID=A0ABW8D501_9GAMM
MAYYFGSNEQVNGDIKYNEHDFAEALKYYKKGLGHLHQIAAQRNFTPNGRYNDALAYVLSDVVVCSTDLLRASLKGKLNYSEIMEAWKDISSTLQELEVVYTSDSIQRYTGSQTTSERMDTVYSAVALAAEAISDRLIDWLDKDIKKKPTEKQFLSALTWLSRAVDNQNKAGLDIETELHLGYLNLLERAFYCDKNKRILFRITDYIKNNSLHDLDLEPEEKLELLGYELLVAVENNDQCAHELARQCKVIMTDIMMEEECELFLDLRQLMTRLPRELADEVLAPMNVRKKKKRKNVIEDEEDDTATSTAPLDITIESHVKHRKANDIEVDGAVSLRTADVVDSEPMLDIDSPSEASSELAPHVEPHTSVRPVLHTTTLFTVRHTFFAPQVNPTALSVEPKGPKAFKKAMYHIAEHYNSPAFLANLLSVVADFYYKSRDLPFKNLPITAYSLYCMVLKLDPQHKVAKSRMEAIYNQNTRMIKDNKNFSGSAPFLVINAQDIFVHAIKDNIREIETYMIGKPEQLDILFNRFMLFVTTTIKNAGIAGNQSTLIAELLKSKYENSILTATLEQVSHPHHMHF